MHFTSISFAHSRIIMTVIPPYYDEQIADFMAISKEGRGHITNSLLINDRKIAVYNKLLLKMQPIKIEMIHSDAWFSSSHFYSRQDVEFVRHILF